jgi:hypothetical protein
VVHPSVSERRSFFGLNATSSPMPAAARGGLAEAGLGHGPAGVVGGARARLDLRRVHGAATSRILGYLWSSTLPASCLLLPTRQREASARRSATPCRRTARADPSRCSPRGGRPTERFGAGKARANDHAADVHGNCARGRKTGVPTTARPISHSVILWGWRLRGHERWRRRNTVRGSEGVRPVCAGGATRARIVARTKAE